MILRIIQRPYTYLPFSLFYQNIEVLLDSKICCDDIEVSESEDIVDEIKREE